MLILIKYMCQYISIFATQWKQESSLIPHWRAINICKDKRMGIEWNRALCVYVCVCVYGMGKYEKSFFFLFFNNIRVCVCVVFDFRLQMLDSSAWRHGQLGCQESVLHDSITKQFSPRRDLGIDAHRSARHGARITKYSGVYSPKCLQRQTLAGEVDVKMTRITSRCFLRRHDKWYVDISK